MRRMGIHTPEPVITVCTTKYRGYALTGKYANIRYLSRSFCHYRPTTIEVSSFARLARLYNDHRTSSSERKHTAL